MDAMMYVMFCLVSLMMGTLGMALYFKIEKWKEDRKDKQRKKLELKELKDELESEIAEHQKEWNSIHLAFGYISKYYDRIDREDTYKRGLVLDIMKKLHQFSSQSLKLSKEKRAKKMKLMDLIARKKEDNLSATSLEDLKKQLMELDA